MCVTEFASYSNGSAISSTVLMGNSSKFPQENFRNLEMRKTQIRLNSHHHTVTEALSVAQYRWELRQNSPKKTLSKFDDEKDADTIIMVTSNSRHQAPALVAYGVIVLLVCLIVFMNVIGENGFVQSVDRSDTISKWTVKTINYTALFSSAMSASYIDIDAIILEDAARVAPQPDYSLSGRTNNTSEIMPSLAHSINESDLRIAVNGKQVAPSTKYSSLEQTIIDTTRLLYKNSPHLDKWLAAPMPKVYFYDTIPKNWSDVPTISRCVNEKWLRESAPDGGERFINWTNCLWEPKVCDDVRGPRLNLRQEVKFMNYKANYNNDVAFVQWFEGYPQKTNIASEADLFFVPYPHWSHCICNRDLRAGSIACQMGVAEIEENVLKHLAHYEAYKERHLFLFGTDWGIVRKAVRNHFLESMSISLGPADACKGKTKELCGHFVTPYLSSGAAFQPGAIRELGEDWWMSRNRTYSVGAAFGTPRDFELRVELMKNHSIHFGASVGGLPLDLLDLGLERRQLLPSRITEVYNSSVFCPILPGDGCPQKRFFDVILNGCIPVVPVFTPSDERGYPTFWKWSDRCSIRRTYPFSKGYFFDDLDAGIDYMSLVVAFDGFCGIPCMKSAMEAVMRNSTELQRLRGTMKEYAGLFTFGLGENMYKNVDAFTAMLVSVRHYLFKLDEKKR
jgi:hypothetical protein